MRVFEFVLIVVASSHSWKKHDSDVKNAVLQDASTNNEF